MRDSDRTLHAASHGNFTRTFHSDTAAHASRLHRTDIHIHMVTDGTRYKIADTPRIMNNSFPTYSCTRKPTSLQNDI